MVNAAVRRNDVIRLVALGLLVILEGFAVVSTVLNVVFVPLGTAYPNVASVTILVLPVIIGLIARRVEVAVVLTVLPFFVLALVYTAVYAPVWNIDLFQLGVMAERVAGAAFLLGGLGAFGWMSRRIFNRSAQ
jgi:amino acid permease